MATIKIKFRTSSVKTKEGVLFYQIIHARVTRQINTGYKIFPSEWDKHLACIILPDNNDIRRRFLAQLTSQIAEDMHRLKNIISKLEHSGNPFTSGKIIELFRIPPINKYSFLSFAQDLIIQLKQIGKERTAESYASAYNSFKRFMDNNGDVLLEDVNSNLMIKYEIYLKNCGVCPNSCSYYMRNLRAIYNRAVEKELTQQQYPFKYVYTGIDKTVKRAVSLKTIRQIQNLDLSTNPLMDYARDIFMFSFYTRGMSFIDMAYLKKSDLKNGIIIYRRRKTGQQLTIKWEKCMEDIIAKNDGCSTTQYLLPIITNPCADERTQYRNAISRINVALKEVARLAGLNMPLTMHCARHCWASIAKSKNIPLSVISEGMGHDSEETTRIYLASLDTNVVDKANSLILKDL